MRQNSTRTAKSGVSCSFHFVIHLSSGQFDPLQKHFLPISRGFSKLSDRIRGIITSIAGLDKFGGKKVLNRKDKGHHLHLTEMATKVVRSGSVSVDPDQTFILGIDIGTTSVKVCIVDTATRAVVAIQSKETQANVPSECGTEGNKQDVPKICSTLHACITRLPREMLKRIVYIGVCGQMHGVVLWKSKEAWELEGEKRIPKVTSNLYTWQDNRCTKDFLVTLPRPDSHLNVHTGYGCATIFWMNRNKPEKLETFDRAGTIQDFVVAMLCDLDVPVMSVQNAASWGYFNTQKKEWNKEILEKAGFPVRFLPNVVMGGDYAGKLTGSSWHLIPPGTPVGAGMGDFQCSVLSTLHRPDQAILNISTSGQLAFVMRDGFEPGKRTDGERDQSVISVGHVEYFPYFQGKYLAVAAALTGGNALAAYVRLLQSWCVELGANIPQSKIWEKILHAGADPGSRSNLHIVPTIFGERHAPDQNANVYNIDLGNVSLGQVTRALCRGIIANLHDMMPKSMLEEAGIRSVIGSGSALSRNPILQQEFLDIFQLDTQFGQGGDAAYGAALAVMKNL